MRDNSDNSKKEASETCESDGDNGNNGKIAVLGNGHCKHVSISAGQHFSKEEKLKC